MKELNLEKENINKLITTFAIPCIISMLINSVYNIVDQIFIGKGVGTLGNAATNVIFPLVIIFNAIAGLIGNGCAAGLSLKLGEGNKEEAKKYVGSSIVLIIVVSLIIGVTSYILLPKLVYLFGCTKNVYQYAIDYGKIIIIGSPFVIIYTALSSIIRADGSPKYSMTLLVTGAIINLILDPLFIFTFNMGVKGGALATIIGQIISFIMAIIYIPKIKSIKLNRRDFKLNKSIFRVLSLGLSSFITQLTVLALFIFMNNIMTKYGGYTKFGADIPLSVYGIVSKLNNFYVSSVLGISIGVQPIIGFNYGAKKYERVRETLNKTLTINFIIGIIFNLLMYFFPNYLVSIFISKTDPNYTLFMEFAILTCRTFLMLCFLNALEMTTSIVVQSLGNVKKATAVSFIRQIILFIPISLLLCIVFSKGIYGALYAGPIADSICFIICIFIYKSEVDKLKSNNENKIMFKDENIISSYKGKKIIITISREYGSGGRYVGKLLAEDLGIIFYDKNIISLAAKESGLSEEYINNIDQKKKNGTYQNNNDDRLFITESKVINKIANNNSCIIVGRCADYILRNNKNVISIFLYSDNNSKVARAVKYYGLSKDKALKEITKINKERAKHYKFYTNRDWLDFNNYDLCLNVDQLGIENTVKLIKEYIDKRIG